MTTAAAHFDRMYAEDDDPWRFRTSWYEIRKRAVLMAALPNARYRSAFEPGCANGEFTAELAARCDRVVAWDCSARAVELAQLRLADLLHVDIRCDGVPGNWPAIELDLIVINELAYFLDEADLSRLCDRIGAASTRDATVLACHWTHAESDSGLDAVGLHRRLGAAASGRANVVHHTEPDFILDIWSRRPAQSEKEMCNK